MRPWLMFVVVLLLAMGRMTRPAPPKAEVVRTIRGNHAGCVVIDRHGCVREFDREVPR